MSKKNLTNASIIRECAEDVGFHHTNIWIKNYIKIKYKRDISVQQIAAVLGRYRDRKYVDCTQAHINCRKFLQSCANDFNLAKKVLAAYGGGV